MSRANTSNYRQLFTEDIPLLDVRAPIEFEKGAYPQSANIPLLNDDQRCLVGTCYKEKGQDAAIALGHTLIHSEIKEQRIEAWKKFIDANPKGYLYCFRGGLRSRITQGWLKEAGIDFPMVEGGYKALRTFLLDELESNIKNLSFVMLGGRTATAKTHLLKTMSRAVDLEGLANHRGSSFGAMVTKQPSQINFENQLSIEFIKQNHKHNLPVIIEDEGSRIGQSRLPLELHRAMAERYPLILLDCPMSERVDNCLKDYITDLYPHFLSAYGEEAHDKFSERYLANLFRIQKRLGGDRYKVVNDQFIDALKSLKNGDESGFKAPFETLLKDYYDPMYDYQLTKREGKVLFKGNKKSITEWFNAYKG